MEQLVVNGLEEAEVPHLVVRQEVIYLETPIFLIINHIYCARFTIYTSQDFYTHLCVKALLSKVTGFPSVSESVSGFPSESESDALDLGRLGL